MSPGRLKLSLLLGGLAASGLVLVSWTQPWFVLSLTTGQSIEVAGDVVAGGLAALGLAGLALGAALAIAGRVFRVILGLLEVAIGGLVSLSALLAVLDPIGASGSAITTATAVSGGESVRALVESVSSTAWPVIGVVLGVLCMLLGFAVVLTSPRWPVSSRKYQAVRFEQDSDDRSPVGDWDALSEGRDPT